MDDKTKGTIAKAIDSAFYIGMENATCDECGDNGANHNLEEKNKKISSHIEKAIIDNSIDNLLKESGNHNLVDVPPIEQLRYLLLIANYRNENLNQKPTTIKELISDLLESITD